MTPREPAGSRGIPRNVGTAFVVGFAVAAVAGLLIFWLLPHRDSEAATTELPPPPAPTATVPETPPAGVSPHGTPTALPEAIATLLESPQTRLAADPEDLQARKEIAVILLRNGQLVLAFEAASEILARRPDDVDGLYVHAAVRVAMGQSRKALELLDRVLAQVPDHVPALVEKGKALEKAGNTTMAIASWERGLAAAGGNHEKLERLLGQARATAAPNEILGWLAEDAQVAGQDPADTSALAPLRSSATGQTR